MLSIFAELLNYKYLRFFTIWVLFLGFISRGLFFSKLLEEFLKRKEIKKIFCFIPCFQFYLFCKKLVDERHNSLFSKVSIVIAFVLPFIFFLIFTLFLFFDVYALFFRRDLYLSEKFSDIFIHYFILTCLFWRIFRIHFNFQYASVLEIILRDLAVKDRFVMFLVKISVLFFSEQMALLIVLKYYMRHIKRKKELEKQKL